MSLSSATPKLSPPSHETAIREGQSALAAVFSLSPFPILVWKAEGQDLRLIDCNEAASRQTGGFVRRSIGMKASEFNLDMERSTIFACLSEKRPMKVRTKRRFGDMAREEWIFHQFVFSEPDLVVQYVSNAEAEQSLESVHERHESAQVRIRELEHGYGLLLDFIKSDDHGLPHTGDWD